MTRNILLCRCEHEALDKMEQNVSLRAGEGTLHYSREGEIETHSAETALETRERRTN